MTHAARGCFVTGTDTGVGKTVIACALVRALRRRGLRVGVIKPIETGVKADGPADALALRAAADVSDSLERICPQQFALPAAPSVAARAEGRSVELATLDRALHAVAAGRDFVLAEGAGGLLVPVADGIAMADLAARWGLPLLVVARAALGTINHTLLTLEAAERRGLRLAGVVISHADGVQSGADAANLAALRRALGTRLLGEVPHLAAGAEPDLGDAARRLAGIAQSG